MSAGNDTLTTLVSAIVAELKAHNINPEINLNQFQSQVVGLISDVRTRIGGQNWKTIEAYFSQSSVIQQIVRSCTTSMTLVLQDGKIDISDTPYFLDLVYQIFNEINSIHDSSKTVTIDADTLIILCGFMLKVILTYCINDKANLAISLSLVQSSLQLLSFKMTPMKWSMKCCC